MMLPINPRIPMTSAIVNYFTSHNVRVMLSIGGSTYTGAWDQALTTNAGMNLHVETLYGENNHHIAESAFKGLARALRSAVAIDPRRSHEIPSTKGSLAG